MDQFSKGTLENETGGLPGLKGKKVVVTAGATGEIEQLSFVEWRRYFDICLTD